MNDFSIRLLIAATGFAVGGLSWFLLSIGYELTALIILASAITTVFIAAFWKGLI